MYLVRARLNQLLSSLVVLVCLEIWFLIFRLVTDGKKSWKIETVGFSTMLYGAMAATLCFSQLADLVSTLSVLIASAKCSDIILRMTTQNPSCRTYSASSVQELLEPKENLQGIFKMFTSRSGLNARNVV